MFANLRQGSQLYVFHKCASTPYIESGSVETTSNVMMGYYPSMPVPINISVKVGDKTAPYQNLPPNAEVADVTNNTTGETITIACTKEALNAEIQSARQKSIESINSVPYHQQRIKALDALYQQFNPEQAEKAQREQELRTMREDMVAMRKQMEEQAEINKMLLAQLKGEGTSSSNPKEKKGEQK